MQSSRATRLINYLAEEKRLIGSDYLMLGLFWLGVFRQKNAHFAIRAGSLLRSVRVVRVVLRTDYFWKKAVPNRIQMSGNYSEKLS